MTLKDIAEKAGVSVSTASRVLNNNIEGAASKEIRDRLRAIAEANNYVAGRTSKIYRKGKAPNKTILCLFARENPETTGNPYFVSIAQSVEAESLKENYASQHYFSAVDINENNIDLIIPKNCAGAVIIGRHEEKLIQFLNGRIKHLVYVGLNKPASNTYDCVVSDPYEMGIQATEYLIGKKHTKIGYIGEKVNEGKYDGYLAAMQKAKLETNNEWVQEAISMQDGYFAVQNIIKSEDLPSALFCMNDRIAIGALRAINESKITMSVIGTDDIEASSFTTPKLTTIHIPSKEMGTFAAKTLIDRIEGRHDIIMKINLPFYIVERESCKDYC